MDTEIRIIKGNCYIEETKDGPCVVGFYDAYEPHLKIPEGVVRIGRHAFERYYGLETVEIPSSVNYIGDHAFCRCSSLKTITLGSNIKALHKYAFSDCFQLAEADLTLAQIEILEEGMFNNCKKLHTIKLPRTLIQISSHSIKGAENCISLELHEGLKVIEEANLEFMNQISIVDLPSSVIHIPDLRYFDQIHTIALSKEQHERFSEYLPLEAKIIFKDQSSE